MYHLNGEEKIRHVDLKIEFLPLIIYVRIRVNKRQRREFFSFIIIIIII